MREAEEKEYLKHGRTGHYQNRKILLNESFKEQKWLFFLETSAVLMLHSDPFLAPRESCNFLSSPGWVSGLTMLMVSEASHFWSYFL